MFCPFTNVKSKFRQKTMSVPFPRSVEAVSCWHFKENVHRLHSRATDLKSGLSSLDGQLSPAIPKAASDPPDGAGSVSGGGGPLGLGGRSVHSGSKRICGERRIQGLSLRRGLCAGQGRWHRCAVGRRCPRAVPETQDGSLSRRTLTATLKPKC